MKPDETKTAEEAAVRPSAAPEPSDDKRESGLPGGGAGRRDEVGGSGVYPASAGSAPEGAEIRNQASWGQGVRGAAGYEDSGPSELFYSEAELKAAEAAEEAEESRDLEKGENIRKEGGEPRETA